MVELPAVGSRVSLRHRLPPGSAKPLTDVVGHLVAVGTEVLVRTKSGEIVTVAAADVVAVRELSHSPVRTSEIRALEHAAALAWPGVEQQWLNGWLLRFGRGVTSRANSAVPLDVSAKLSDLLEIADWYRQRDLPPWVALPERLLPVRADGVKHTRVMVRDVDEHDSGSASASVAPASVVPASVAHAALPDADWLRIYERDVPVDVLSAVIDGEVTFARIGDAAVGRGAVTAAPDGTRWLGISSVRVAPEQRRRGHARTLCESLSAWGAAHGAQRAYVQVLADNDAAVALYTSMGFRLHHGCRYWQPQH